MKNKTTFLLLRNDYKSITDLLFNFYNIGVHTDRLGWGFSEDRKSDTAVAVEMVYYPSQSLEIRQMLDKFNIEPILNIEKYNLFLDRVLVTGDTCELSAQVFTNIKKRFIHGTAA